MKQDHVLNAIHKASHETSRLAGAHLRAEANASHWPAHIVSGMNVTYSKDGFVANVHDKHYDQALDHEYGTPDRQPTAAVRRSANRTRESENFLVHRIAKNLEGLL